MLDRLRGGARRARRHAPASPRRTSAGLFDARLVAVSLLQGASVLAASVLAFRLGFHHTGADDAGRALAFAALIGGNVALILVNRSWHKTVLGALSARNPASWLVVGAAALFATLAFAARSCGAHSTSG